MSDTDSEGATDSETGSRTDPGPDSGRDPETDPGTDVAARADDRASLVDASDAFYRAEMDRVTTWRTRLDQTTNWAVVVMAAILTFAFSSAGNPHYVLLVGALAVLVFLLVEAQRFQEYDAWRRRIRVLQADLYGGLYDRRSPESSSWREWLGDDLRDPTFDVSLPLAVGHRLQHVYLPLISVLLAAWWLRVTVFEARATWQETASVATIDGPTVVTAVLVAYLSLVALTAWSARHLVRREFAVGDDESPTEPT